MQQLHLNYLFLFIGLGNVRNCEEDKLIEIRFVAHTFSKNIIVSLKGLETEFGIKELKSWNV